MRRADVGNVHDDLRVLADDVTSGTRVVEVDVREQQVPDVVQVDGVAQTLEARRGAAVEERRPFRGVDLVDADHALETLVAEVDRL